MPEDFADSKYFDHVKHGINYLNAVKSGYDWLGRVEPATLDLEWDHNHILSQIFAEQFPGKHGRPSASEIIQGLGINQTYAISCGFLLDLDTLPGKAWQESYRIARHSEWKRLTNTWKFLLGLQSYVKL